MRISDWSSDVCSSDLSGVAGQDDEVGDRDLLAVLLLPVELGLDSLEHAQHVLQLRGVVDLPVLLRGEADAGAVDATALVAAAEGGRSEERRVGTECVSKFRSRGAADD